jgi:hypothetical protein
MMFYLRGENGYIKITLVKVFGFPDKTSYAGGYDTESEIEIKSQNYFFKGAFWTTTGEIYSFYKKLEQCQTELKGTVEYKNYEYNLDLKIVYGETGHVKFVGEYIERPDLNTKLIFSINSDQSYLQNSLPELKIIIDKYGDNSGTKNK